MIPTTPSLHTVRKMILFNFGYRENSSSMVSLFLKLYSVTSVHFTTGLYGLWQSLVLLLDINCGDVILRGSWVIAVIIF